MALIAHPNGVSINMIIRESGLFGNRDYSGIGVTSIGDPYQYILVEVEFLLNERIFLLSTVPPNESMPNLIDFSLLFST